MPKFKYKGWDVVYRKHKDNSVAWEAKKSGMRIGGAFDIEKRMNVKNNIKKLINEWIIKRKW